MNSLVKTELEGFARRLRNAIDLRRQSDEDFLSSTLEISAVMVEVRDHFKDHISFGRWCDENGVDMSHQDRAAYIAFGRDLARAREVLAKTESRSIQLIHRKEFRFTSASKTAKSKTGPTTTPELQKALDAYDAFKAAGVEPTQTQVEERAGVSSTAVRRAFERRLTEAEVARKEPDLGGLSPTSREKVDAAVRKIQRRMDQEYDGRLQAAVRKHMAEIIMPMYAEKLAMADRVLAVNKKPFTIGEYRKLLGALHPDASSVELRTEMFMLVKEREYLLRPAEKDKPLSGDLPQTIEELLARRRRKTP